MQLYDEAIGDIRRFIKEKADAGMVADIDAETSVSWPRSDGNAIILKADTGLELGGPGFESLSFLVWTNNRSLVADNSITRVGHDLPHLPRKALPFGKVVLVAGRDFAAENIHERFRELELLRFDLALEGYMVRAVSQEMKEWSRVSTKALRAGFSFSTLGGALIEKYKELDYVTAAEVLFLSSSATDVGELRPTGNRVIEYVNAIRKMTEEQSYDCANCDFQAICRDVDELKRLRKSLMKSK